MKSTIGAIALIGAVLAAAAAIALAGATAFAEAASPAADTRANFAGISSLLGFNTTDQWTGIHSIGRLEPPAGR